MKHRSRNIIIMSVVLLCVLASVLYIALGPKTHLGLDLQGGLEVVFQAKTTGGGVPSSDEMSQTLAIMNKRVNGLGVSEAQVQQQGTDKISVALPGVTNQEQALAIIGKTAQLVFFDDSTTRVVGPTTSESKLWQQASGSIPKKDLAQLKAGTMPTKTISGSTVPKYRIVTADKGMWGNNTQTLYFLYLNKPAMTGAAIKNANQSYDQYNRPDVVMNFTSKGAQQFESVTKELAIRGALQGQSQTFAIVLDNGMESDPQVDYKEYPQGISGSSAEITGSFTVAEAQNLALVLNTGALPVTLSAIEKQQVSATLGADSLRAGLIAGAVGMVLVLIFMVIVYRFLGVIADIALIIYALLLWGVFNAVPVTLTLPGIAGMILTIGVAADANVVVFERIKEEVRLGKSVRSAVNSGYGKGFRTILDANALILLTALVLFYFATAQPKGFALTLMIGTVVSLFTAVLATRAMLGLLAGFKWFEKAEFMGAHPGEQLFEGEFALVQGGGERSRPAARSATSRRTRATRPVPAPAGSDGGGVAEAAAADAGGLAGETDGEEAPAVQTPAGSRPTGARQTGSRTTKGQRPARKKKRSR